MNKYIRTKDGRIAEIKENMIIKVSDDTTRLVYKKEPNICVLNGNDDIINQADTIEELCDEFVLFYKEVKSLHNIPWATYERRGIWEKQRDKVINEVINHPSYKHPVLYGAIWTEKGLIYVAKMNEKGEFKLL